MSTARRPADASRPARRPPTLRRRTRSAGGPTSSRGELGSLPIIVGLIIIAIVFQSQNDRFLTAGNFVNLIVQTAAVRDRSPWASSSCCCWARSTSRSATCPASAACIAALLLTPDGNECADRRRDRRRAAAPALAIGTLPRAADHEGRRPVVRRHARRPARLERRRAAADRQPRHRDPPGRLHHRPRQRLPVRRARRGC